MSFALKSLALIFIYLAVAKVSLIFGTINHSVTIVWPPGGIALAVVLLGGRRYLSAVFLAAFLTGYMLGAPLIFVFLAAFGNVLETYLACILLNRATTFNPKFHHVNDLIAIFILGAMIPSIASATLGPLGLLASGMIHADILPNIIWHWWKSDVLGIVFFTPMILVFVTKAPLFRNPARLLEVIALWAISIALGQVIFLDWKPVVIFEHTPNLVWLLPMIMWAGLRTGKRNTSLIQLLFLSQSLASAYFKVGIFSDDFTHYGLSNFWAFAMFLAILGMGLAIMSTAERHTARKNMQHAKLFEISHDGALIVDARNNIVSINAAFTDITGYTAEDVVGKTPLLLYSESQNQEFYSDMRKTLTELGHWQGEVWNRRKDGSVYLERLVIDTITDTHNKIISYIGIFYDITLEKSKQETIAHQAQHDFLTNLPNRLLFCDRFKQQLAFATRHSKKFAVIYLDLDKFKQVNDTLGHQVGDQLLIAVAERLSELVREIDTVSRFGGDEFAILVSEVDNINDVTTLAKKVIYALSQPFLLDKHTVNVSASIGIALYPDHGTDMITLMHNADIAMYQAKRSGHNNYFITDVI